MAELDLEALKRDAEQAPWTWFAQRETIIAALEDRDRLREAVEDLWSCIDRPQIDDLQPETIELARKNHELLAHSPLQGRDG